MARSELAFVKLETSPWLLQSLSTGPSNRAGLLTYRGVCVAARWRYLGRMKHRVVSIRWQCISWRHLGIQETYFVTHASSMRGALAVTTVSAAAQLLVERALEAYTI